MNSHPMQFIQIVKKKNILQIYTNSSLPNYKSMNSTHYIDSERPVLGNIIIISIILNQ